MKNKKEELKTQLGTMTDKQKFDQDFRKTGDWITSYYGRDHLWTDPVLRFSDDFGIAVEIVSNLYTHQIEMTGRIWKLVKGPLKPEEYSDGYPLESSDNKITYDPNDFCAYEYKPYMVIPKTVRQFSRNL